MQKCLLVDCLCIYSYTIVHKRLTVHLYTSAIYACVAINDI